MHVPAIIYFVPGYQHELGPSIDVLSQCLSQSKRPLAIFLGAGCPAAVRVPGENDTSAPLIPDIAGLTNAVTEELQPSALKAKLGILATGLSQDFNRIPNIEDMLTRLRTLTTVVGDQSVRGLDAMDIGNLEKGITELITSRVLVGLPLPPTPYDDLAVWIGSVSRSAGIRLFTTNYDLLVEEALERNEVPFFDGFVGVTQPFLDNGEVDSDDLPARWARLWKLHGSANWTLLPNGRVVRRAPKNAEERRLIHPSHLKYDESRRMPYLVMQDQLRGFLRQHSATLVTIGYSFGDEHINDLLDQGLRGNATAAAFALLHGPVAKYANASKLARALANLTVLALDGGVIAGREGSWEASADGHPTECKLGDFAELGIFMRRLVGRPAADV